MLFTLLAQMNLVIRTSALGTTYASDSYSVIERQKCEFYALNLNIPPSGKNHSHKNGAILSWLI